MPEEMLTLKQLDRRDTITFAGFASDGPKNSEIGDQTTARGYLHHNQDIHSRREEGNKGRVEDGGCKASKKNMRDQSN